MNCVTGMMKNPKSSSDQLLPLSGFTSKKKKSELVCEILVENDRVFLRQLEDFMCLKCPF